MCRPGKTTGRVSTRHSRNKEPAFAGFQLATRSLIRAARANISASHVCSANGYVHKCRTFAPYVHGRQDKDGQRAKEAKGKRARASARSLSRPLYDRHSLTMARIKQGQNGDWRLGGREEGGESVDAGRGANLWELPGAKNEGESCLYVSVLLPANPRFA
jgi:hypothetical protein